MNESTARHGQPRSGIGELSPTCREAARLQSEALDHPLTLRQRIGLRIHIFLCKWCRRYGRQLRLLRSAAGKHHEHTDALPAQSLRPEIRERIKSQLRAEFFNALNHTNFGTPNATVFSGTSLSSSAGIITSTATTSRQIQFGLKLNF